MSDLLGPSHLAGQSKGDASQWASRRGDGSHGLHLAPAAGTGAGDGMRAGTRAGAAPRTLVENRRPVAQRVTGRLSRIGDCAIYLIARTRRSAVLLGQLERLHRPQMLG